MIGKFLKALHKKPSPKEASQLEAAAAKAPDYGTLIIDGSGNIRSCGIAAGNMFGGILTEFNGKPISSLLPHFNLSDASPSYSVRHNAHICEADGWRKLDAVTVHGEGFSVEINLTRVNMRGKDLFLLNLRRTGMTGFPE